MKALILLALLGFVGCGDDLPEHMDPLPTPVVSPTPDKLPWVDECLAYWKQCDDYETCAMNVGIGCGTYPPDHEHCAPCSPPGTH